MALGASVINPLNGETVPLWVGDYVIGHYGTGAVMAVPADDERDHAFAKQYGLPILQVVAPGGGKVDVQTSAFTDDGLAYEVKSDLPIANGTPSENVRKQITAWLKEQGRG